MNFITKNLGWILLLVFFIFMLFIISSNDPQRVNLTSSWTVASWQTQSWWVDQNLDELMKLIDNENIQDVKSSLQWKDNIKEKVEAEVISNSNTYTDVKLIDWENNDWLTVSIEERDENNIKENKKWFFARLFGKNDFKEGAIEDKSMSWSEIIEAETVIIQQENSESNDLITSEDNFDSSSNIIKVSSDTNTDIHVDKKVIYPGGNLQTQIWKTYEIRVEMLKLNNKYFTQTIELMNRGDRVKQISDENQYGCFQVEVLTTGSNGYVCKKYLTEENTVSTNDIVTTAQESVSIDFEQDIDKKEDTVTEFVPEISTKIGSYYKIAIDNTSFFDVILERFVLQKGDVLKQISNADSKTWCVSMKVVWTTTGEHDWETVAICSPDMVVSI